MVLNNIQGILIYRIKLLRVSYSENLKKIRENFDPDAIHDLRVAIRRILSFISLIDEICRTEVDEPLQQSLKAEIKRFNKLRDIQVQIGILINFIKKYPELLDFLFFLKKKEEKQIKKLRTVITQAGFDLSGEILFYQIKLKDHQCFQNIQMSQIVSVVKNALEDVRTSIQNITLGDYKSYHKTRLTIKKFRYIVETTEEIIMSSKEKLKELQMLQTILGEIQDLTVLLKLFEDFNLNKGTDVSGFLDFVENIKQKREKKEREFWDKLSCLEYWDNFLMNI